MEVSIESATSSLVGIYRIELGAGNFYIGSSSNLVKRKYQHCSQMQRGKHKNSRVQSSYNKYQVFEFSILEECTKENLIAREQFYIDEQKGNRKMNNLTLIAAYSYTEETFAKKSAAATGRVVSEEVKIAISAGRTGKVHTAETRAKMSASASAQQKKTPRVTSEATKAKLRAATLRHNESVKNLSKG
jgi:group I intron endonuclease